ncbi:hypothetical protein FISHEDRAFT_66005 [Fistulina hepatica ATCC 64428]|uniref:Histone-lysine N-methyltransferase, H3 lysine-36 specific n=1 Tax=Fistulina hepatica ATCC 64428 TaxID=1128425 RepID=A0A0D7AB43_9AGAR|nr:hypothetical protein FISHEDRAFT_66005 [Fistulina hepatica ATCC 64428]
MHIAGSVPETSSTPVSAVIDTSAAPTPPLTAESSSRSTSQGSSTPPSTNGSNKSQPLPPQLIGDLPIAREEALKTFHEIEANNYQYKSLGRSREALEGSTCDCVYERGHNARDDACGEDSDCINRLTQVECLPDDCRCGAYCLNQRFQKQEYADIEIVLTEKKGFGLRAERDLPKDAFIYEYVGDIVGSSSFKKRMREYAEEGIRHFYFMMLQKDEFIDATKSGGIGRFANHSCNPNCYVAKWTVGDHVRMGIFAKRKILQHEELTFNYNVDRYGHQAQACYCGEPNCVGFIGGKTQTDAVTLDDLYLDALGITDAADIAELKGSRKKKGKKIDDPDFVPNMKQITEKDVVKVVQALRQVQSKKVLSKLLMRIRMSEDQAALRQIMRLRGFSLMTNILEDYKTETDIIVLTLECISTWPLLYRNKVEDSKVIVPVEALAATSEDEQITGLAQKVLRQLIDYWATLPVAYRIPKRQLNGSGPEVPLSDPLVAEEYEHVAKRPKVAEDEAEVTEFRVAFARRGATRVIKPQLTDKEEMERAEEQRQREARQIQQRIKLENASVENVLQRAIEAEQRRKDAEMDAKAEEQKRVAREAEKKAARRLRRKQKEEERRRRKTRTPEQKEALKEKQLLKLVGAVVVKCMSKYSKAMDHDTFKKYAKELTHVIAEKEKKSMSYKEGKLDSLSEEKVAKIKKFSKEYIAKVLHKLQKAGKYPPRHRDGPTSSAPPSSASTSTLVASSSSTVIDAPDSAQDKDGDVEMKMTVEEAMDMESDSDDGSHSSSDEEDGEETSVKRGNSLDSQHVHHDGNKARRMKRYGANRLYLRVLRTSAGGRIVLRSVQSLASKIYVANHHRGLPSDLANGRRPANKYGSVTFIVDRCG